MDGYRLLSAFLSIKMGINEIESYKEILKNPKAYNLNMKPFNEYFIESEIVTAQHILAESLMKINTAIPKMVIYLLFVEFYGNAREVDTNGDLGYRLSFCA